ncbi:glycosyltransferase WbuB [Anthocerotibacter panamensis]|uniref:glycosyltransferase WbuB n=1 Tax=Anthocerotibacter panamensis TaxID=2857077 RepID=UPI001C407BE8|nr:glycosyltransferase WbuB [Anthocerotibacter panamensis]
MRLLICGINYAPELTGVGKYTGEMAEWFAAQGYDVRVVTAPPYYPGWQVGGGYQSWAYQRERRADVEVFRCPLWVKRNPSGRERLIHLLSFALSSLPVMIQQIFWAPDLVLAVEPTFFSSPTALLVARLSGAQAWLHVQDLEMDAAFKLGLLPHRWWGGLSGVESWLKRQFDWVSSISQPMVDRLLLKGLTPTKTLLFPNWVDTDQIYPLAQPCPLRQELGLTPRDTVVLYAGNLGQKQGLEVLLEAACALKSRPDLHFILCGDGAARERLTGMAQALSLHNVRFMPLQPEHRLNDLLNLADIHALIQKSESADLVMPSKLTGMLASGRPILATADAGTAVAEVMSRANCGAVVPPGDVAALVAAIADLSTDGARRQALGMNGRVYAQRLLEKNWVLSRLRQSLERPLPQTAIKVQS